MLNHQKVNEVLAFISIQRRNIPYVIPPVLNEAKNAETSNGILLRTGARSSNDAASKRSASSWLPFDGLIESILVGLCRQRN